MSGGIFTIIAHNTEISTPQQNNNLKQIRMKTSVVMSRKMGEFEVLQRTKDGMFNATDLLKQWQVNIGERKDVSNFLCNKSTKEFIEALENDNTGIPVFTKNRGKNGGTWMHPLLFIDFAMWINPKFKLTVLKFVHDQLINRRHLAGDNYKTLTSAGKKLKGYNYSKIAVAIQWIVFDKTGKDLRQTATQEQLEEISTLEQKFAFAIDMGYIKTYKGLIAGLQEAYRVKKNKLPF